MAFTFCRKNNRGKTWYVGYYVNGKFVRKKVGRSKTLAEKARGDIEARIERGEVGLLNKDYPEGACFVLGLIADEIKVSCLMVVLSVGVP